MATLTLPACQTITTSMLMHPCLAARMPQTATATQLYCKQSSIKSFQTACRGCLHWLKHSLPSPKMKLTTRSSCCSCYSHSSALGIFYGSDLRPCRMMSFAACCCFKSCYACVLCMLRACALLACHQTAYGLQMAGKVRCHPHIIVDFLRSVLHFIQLASNLDTELYPCSTWSVIPCALPSFYSSVHHTTFIAWPACQPQLCNVAVIITRVNDMCEPLQACTLHMPLLHLSPPEIHIQQHCCFSQAFAAGFWVAAPSSRTIQ